MLTFRQFIREAAFPTATSSGFKLMSLDDFAKTSTVRESFNEAEGDFGLGANVRPMTDDQMQAYLQRVFTKDPDNPTPENKKDKFINPYVHRSLLQKAGGKSVDGKTYLLAPDSDVVVDIDTGNLIDADKLKQEITERPKQLLVTGNVKMEKSGGPTSHFVAFGFPALLGLVVNEKTNEFAVIRTCPGAGQCQLYCYAMKGNFTRYKDANRKQMRILNFLLNDPEGFFRQMSQEITKLKQSVGSKGKTLYIRWHDSGDFFSTQYKERFYKMVEQFKDVEFYAYSKMAHVVNDNHPDNLVMNFSQGAKPDQVKQVDLTKTKHSVVVPKDVFEDILKKKKGEGFTVTPDVEKTLKERLAAKYNVPRESVISYDEMMQKPYDPNITQKWNVYVLPGADGDVSASRRDVHITFLLIH